jgi:SAM-dependent methyltransferase
MQSQVGAGAGTPAADRQAPASITSLNGANWSRGRFVRDYTSRQLHPVEVLLMVRYREDMSGRVLELGCGAGRISGYLCEIAADFHAIDIAAAMVEVCRRRYPRGHFERGDILAMDAFEDGGMDVVFAGGNVIDVFSDEDRRRALREIARVLRPGGLLILTSHNRAYLPRVRGPWHARTSDPLRFAYDLIRIPLHVRRHRRLLPLERRTPGYAIVSDGAHGFTLMHYYIDPERQREQLAEEGFRPLEVLDYDGHTVAEGSPAPVRPGLHYVARRTG